MIKAYFSDNEILYNITYVDEKIPLGAGGRLSLLKGQMDELKKMEKALIVE